MWYSRTSFNRSLCFLIILGWFGTLAHAAKPNFVIFFADDLAYGDLSSYGHPTINTPHIDGLARDGLQLTSFYSGAAVCSPARAALLTGRYPLHAGMPRNTGPGSDVHMDRDQIILPQILRKAGYASMAVGKWHLGHQDASLLPVGRGFDRFYGLPYSNDMIKPWVQTDLPMHLYDDADPVEEVGHEQDHLTVRYTETAVSFIEEQADSNTPFLLYLAYSMPHLPVHAAPERQGTSTAGRYGDVIETIDWSVGQVLEMLDQAGIADNTLVVFTSDNGPWHNLPKRMLAAGNERWHSGNAGPLKGAKGSTHEGGFRVPGLFRFPGVIAAGSRSPEMASTIDLFPTLAHLAKVEIPDDHALDGHNLLPFLQGKEPSPRTEFLYSQGSLFEAVRHGPWKLRIGGREPEIELYHLDRDPSEMYNVAERYPERVAELRDALKARAAHFGAGLRELAE